LDLLRCDSGFRKLKGRTLFFHRFGSVKFFNVAAQLD
jgi:hypothetical protein